MKKNIVLYRHVRLDTNEVFYVGIGDIKRATVKNRRSKWWKRIITKTDYRVDILFDDLSWEEACEKEKEFIQLYGRKDLGLGTLVNMTDGGDGTIGRKMSEKTKDKIIKANTGRKQSDSHKLKISKAKLGHKQSEESINKRRLALKGKSRPQEVKDKISKGNKIIILQLDLDDNIIRKWDSAIDAERMGGFNSTKIAQVCKGKYGYKTHKGYKWKYYQGETFW
jgi:hypothetical protein